MKDLIFKFMKRNGRLVLGAALVLALFVGVLVNAAKNKDEFTPGGQENHQLPFQNEDMDKTFDGKQSATDGLEIEENTEDDEKEKELEEGDDELLSKDDSDLQDQLINIANLVNPSDNGTKENPVPSQNPSAPVLNVGQKDDGDPSTPPGIGPVPGIGDNPGNGDGGKGDGKGDGNDDDKEKEDPPVTPPKPGEDKKPPKNPSTNQDLTHGDDDASYGNKDENKTADSKVPDNTFEGGTIRMVNCVQKSDQIYLFQGECPTAELMKDYLSVDARISVAAAPGQAASTVHVQDLNYSYKNNRDSYGGDYCVDWNSAEEGTQNQAPLQPGIYQASVFMINPDNGTQTQARAGFSYTVYDYQLELEDFEENYSALSDSAKPQLLHAGENEEISLVAAISNMNKIILQRTNSGKKYTHILKKNADGTYASFFGGWSLSKDGATVGNVFELSHVKAEELLEDADGNKYYKKTLYPVWISAGDASSYYEITLKNDGSVTAERYLGDCRSVKTLDIPNGVTVVDLTSIGRDSFPVLTLINIPEIVTSILYLDSMTMYPKLSAFGVADENKLFMDVSGILYSKSGKTLLRVPPAMSNLSAWSKYVESIGSKAFLDVKMAQVSLPASVREIGEHAFDQAKIATLTEQSPQIVWGSGNLIRNGAGAFNISHIQVEDSPEDAVYLKRISSLSDYLTTEGSDSPGNDAMSILTTPSGVEKNYQYKEGWILDQNQTRVVMGTAAAGTQAVLPEGVTMVKSGALSGCMQLQRLTMSSTVNMLPDGCFLSDSLTAVYFTTATPPNMAGGKIFGSSIPDRIRLYVPVDYLTDYLNIWKRYEQRGYGSGTTAGFTVPYGDGISQDEAGAVYWEETPGAFTLLSGEQVAGEYTVKEGTTKIKSGAFLGNTALSAIHLGSAIQTIEAKAFQECTALTTVTVGGPLTTVGDYAFNKCSALSVFQWENVAATRSLSSIGQWAFAESGLTGIPVDLVSAAGEPKLFTVRISQDGDLSPYNSCVIFEGDDVRGRGKMFPNLSSIGDYAFAYCQNISYMSIPQFGDIEAWKALLYEKWNVNWFMTNTTISPTPVPCGSSYDPVKNPTAGGGEGGGGGEII